MSLLFNILMTLVLLMGIMVVLVGTLWIFSLILNEMLEVDILWKLKRKARELVYGETLGGMHRRGESRCDSNRVKAISLKRVVSHWRDIEKAIPIQSDKTTKKSRRGGEKV